MAHYATGVVVSLGPPVRYVGDEVLDPAGAESWFQTWVSPIGYDISELVIEAGNDTAFYHGLVRTTGTKTHGTRVDL